MEEKFITFERYPSLMPGIQKKRDYSQTRWYMDIISNSSKNKMELIREDPENAYRLFARYSDDEGLRLMVNNSGLDEITKKIAQMQLDSVLSSRKTRNLARPIQNIGPLSKFCYTERKDITRVGNSPVISDINYHG